MPTFAFSTTNTRLVCQIIPTPQELRPAPDMFVMEFDYTGYRCFGRLTGRTRRMFGHDCPTIERIAIETVVDVLPGQVDSDGEQAYAIWGDPGHRLPGGTFAVHPHKIAANGKVAL